MFDCFKFIWESSSQYELISSMLKVGSDFLDDQLFVVHVHCDHRLLYMLSGIRLYISCKRQFFHPLGVLVLLEYLGFLAFWAELSELIFVYEKFWGPWWKVEAYRGLPFSGS